MNKLNELNQLNQHSLNMTALLLRVGLGLVFVIGGISKLNLLLDASTQAAMVANYMGTSGYINELFQDFLFSGGRLSPRTFLTALSSFELLSGIALISGFLVRPLALLYAFLLWSFVVSLPVDTVPGASVGVDTYTSPAIFVQIRDITLSGMMFVLFNLGSGYKSIDQRLRTENLTVNWDALGLLLRLSLGVTFIIAGLFGDYAKIQSFATYQPLLLALGGLLIFAENQLLKATAVVCTGVLVWYILQKLSFDKSLIANLNGVKREFALLAASIVLALFSGGARFTFKHIVKRSKLYLSLNLNQ